MKLYSMAPQDSSGKVRWLLNELNIVFEDIKLSYRDGDLKSSKFLKLNPMGQAPVLEENITLTESYAMVLYLADKYSEKQLAPLFTDFALRASYYQWVMFSSNSAEDFFGRYFKIEHMTEEYKKNWEAHTRDKTQKVLSTIEQQVSNQEFLLGYFSAADICLAYALDMISEEPFFNDYPSTKKYYERLKQRPACLKSEVFKR